MSRFLRQISGPDARRISVPVLALLAGAVFLSSASALFLADDGRSKKEGAPVSILSAPSTVSSDTTPGGSATPGPTTSRRGIPGFPPIALAVTPLNEAPRNYCALLADTNTQRSQGLMRQPDMAGYDAMVFRFPEDTSSAFYTANVQFPLSIAWFGADGAFLSSADMAPCRDDPARCQLYRASGPYRFAVEVSEGGLGPLGITAGSIISLGGPCT